MRRLAARAGDDGRRVARNRENWPIWPATTPNRRNSTPTEAEAFAEAQGEARWRHGAGGPHIRPVRPSGTARHTNTPPNASAASTVPHPVPPPNEGLLSPCYQRLAASASTASTKTLKVNQKHTKLLWSIRHIAAHRKGWGFARGTGGKMRRLFFWGGRSNWAGHQAPVRHTSMAAVL